MRGWPASSVIGEGFALRPLVADDREPFLRSMDHEVRYWQGLDERSIETYTAMFEPWWPANFGRPSQFDSTRHAHRGL